MAIASSVAGPERRALHVLIMQSERSAGQTAQLDEILASLDIKHHRVGSVQDALLELRQKSYDLVMTDLILTDASGTDVILRLTGEAPYVPLIVLTEAVWESQAVEANNYGAEDWLVYERLTTEIVSRTIRFVIEKKQLKTSLRSMSLIDASTGLYNSAGFVAATGPLMVAAERLKKKYLIVYVRIQNLEQIAKEKGRHERETAVIRTGQIIFKTMRNVDVCARLEAGSFAILAFEATEETAHIVFSRLRKNLEQKQESESWPYRIKLACGAVAPTAPAAGLESLLEQARTLAV